MQRVWTINEVSAAETDLILSGLADRGEDVVLAKDVFKLRKNDELVVVGAVIPVPEVRISHVKGPTVAVDSCGDLHVFHTLLGDVAYKLRDIGRGFPPGEGFVAHYTAMVCDCTLGYFYFPNRWDAFLHAEYAQAYIAASAKIASQIQAVPAEARMAPFILIEGVESGFVFKFAVEHRVTLGVKSSGRYEDFEVFVGDESRWSDIVKAIKARPGQHRYFVRGKTHGLTGSI